MRRRTFVSALLLVLLPLAIACGGYDDTATAPEVPEATLDLTFTGDATFQGPHAGQTIHVGIVHPATSMLVDSDQGVVSSSEDPSFSFTFVDVLAEGETYRLDYWIDSNFNGGTEGTCDPPENDHQWRIDISSVTGDVTIADTHRPGETQNVCGGSDDSGGSDPGY